MLSFHGQTELKARVSSQMHQHIRDAEMGDVIVGDVRLHLYGWKHQTIDYTACESALGIPQDLMRLGVFLTEGFPDGKEGIREVVRLRRRFVDAIPVGVDLREVSRRFLLWLLLDEEVGPARFVDRPLIVDATLRVTDLLSTRDHRPAEIALAEESASAAHAAVSAEYVASKERPRAKVCEDLVNAAASLVGAARFAAGEPRAITEAVDPLAKDRRDDLFAEKLFAILAE